MRICWYQGQGRLPRSRSNIKVTFLKKMAVSGALVFHKHILFFFFFFFQIMISVFRKEEIQCWVDLCDTGYVPSLYMFTIRDNKVEIHMEILKQCKSTCCFTLCQTIKFWTGLKLETFADDKIDLNEKLKPVLGRIENIVRKGENAGYQHFLLFPLCFQRPSHLGSLIVGIVYFSHSNSIIFESCFSFYLQITLTIYPMNLTLKSSEGKRLLKT